MRKKQSIGRLSHLIYKASLLSMEPWPAAKKLSVSEAVPPAPVRVSSQRPFAPSVVSVKVGVLSKF